MDVERARALLAAERDEVSKLLAETQAAGREDRDTEDQQDADIADPAQSLTQQGMDDAIAESLRDRLAALERAEQRLADGSYGRSVQSGQTIPDERLEADPAAELTVEEAAAQEAADRWPAPAGQLIPRPAGRDTGAGRTARTGGRRCR